MRLVRSASATAQLQLPTTLDPPGGCARVNPAATMAARVYPYRSRPAMPRWRAGRAGSRARRRCWQRPACPALRRREGGYAGLCAIVCGQQLSTASAAAIRGTAVRGLRSVPSRRDTAGARRQARHGSACPSRRSSRSRRSRTAIAKGHIDLDARRGDAGRRGACRAHRAARHRPLDRRHLSAVLPRQRRRLAGRRSRVAGVGAASPSSSSERPDAKAMVKLAETWRPWRGVAAHLLWAYYHAVKRREGAPVQADDNRPKT